MTREHVAGEEGAMTNEERAAELRLHAPIVGRAGLEATEHVMMLAADALAEAQARIASLESRLRDSSHQWDTDNSRSDELEAALRFYARADRYDVLADGGERARAALEKP